MVAHWMVRAYKVDSRDQFVAIPSALVFATGADHIDCERSEDDRFDDAV